MSKSCVLCPTSYLCSLRRHRLAEKSISVRKKWPTLSNLHLRSALSVTLLGCFTRCASLCPNTSASKAWACWSTTGRSLCSSPILILVPLLMKLPREMARDMTKILMVILDLKLRCRRERKLKLMKKTKRMTLTTKLLKRKWSALVLFTTPRLLPSLLAKVSLVKFSTLVNYLSAMMLKKNPISLVILIIRVVCKELLRTLW